MAAARVIDDCGARQAHEAEVDSHLMAGLEALRRLPQGSLPAASAQALEEMAQALTRRCS